MSALGGQPDPRRRRPAPPCSCRRSRWSSSSAASGSRPGCRGGSWCCSAASPPRRRWTCRPRASRSSGRCRAGCRPRGCRSVAAGDLAGPARRRSRARPGRPRGGAERGPAVRRAGRLPDRRRPGAARLRGGQRRLAGCSVASGWPGACPRRPRSATPAGAPRWRGWWRRGWPLVVIVAIAPALSDLPRAVLSAIVVNAVWKLMDFGALRRYARVRRNDIVAAVVAAVGRARVRPAVRPAARGGRVGARPGLPVQPGRRRGHGQGAATRRRRGGASASTRSARRTPGCWCSGSTRRSSGSPPRRSTTPSSPGSTPTPGITRAGARPGGDQPDGHDQRRRARRPPGHAARRATSTSTWCG